jgi:hypothetical protein
VLANDTQDLTPVLSANVALKPGEQVELLQCRQLGLGLDVFVAVGISKL